MIRGTSITFIVIIALLLCGWLQTCENAKRVESALHTSQEQAKIWKDKYGHSNAELTVLQLDKSNFLKFHNDIVDSLKRQGIKPKQIVRIETITAHTTDTVVLVNNRYHDQWADFTKLEDNKFAYDIRDSLALVTYDKPYGFLHLKTKYTTRAISYNPHTTLTGLTSTEIIPKERRLSLGVYGGYGATLSGSEVKTGPQIGFGINLRIF
jgi:hypothetical protein